MRRVPNSVTTEIILHQDGKQCDSCCWWWNYYRQIYRSVLSSAWYCSKIWSQRQVIIGNWCRLGSKVLRNLRHTYKDELKDIPPSLTSREKKKASFGLLPLRATWGHWGGNGWAIGLRRLGRMLTFRAWTPFWSGQSWTKILIESFRQ